MDSKDAETKRKLKALAAYIEKQLASGTAPKDLYKDLIERKVPHQLAVEMIEKGRAKQLPVASLPDEPAVEKPTREDRIREYINARADEGKTVNEIYDLLVEKDVSHDQASDLIMEETGITIKPPDNGLAVSATLPVEHPQIAMPPIENTKEILVYVAGQLTAGVEPKPLVESLVERGMGRNQSIDLVMDVKQNLEAEMKEAATNPEGATKADLRKRGLRNMLIGGALFVVGSCITLISYMSADEGGVYWLFYGPIIYGLISGIMGLVQWLRNG
jgi:hypothetical protein